LNLALNFALIPYIGIVGAAIGMLSAFALAFFATTYYSDRYLHFSFHPGFLLRSVIASVVMSLLLIWLNPERTLELVVAVVGGSVVYFAALILIGGISKEEINSLRKMF
jgi:O-antigen/teichoic acid export membrane protein